MDEALFSLRGRVAVVTGASRGIGSSLASALAHAGAAIALLGRDERSLAELHAALAARGCSVMHVTADVGVKSSIDAAFEHIVRSMPRLDILINNAGVEQSCPSLEVSEALWDRIVDTNLKGAFFCAQAAARHMPNGGSVINVCSLTSEVGVAGAAPYGASKSGLAGLTRTLATEWAPKGIRVNGIGPGYFRTALTESFYLDEQWQHEMLAKIPLRRFGRLDDLGGAAVFLSSEAAAYITGQILYVDGGYMAAL
ncbi:MAG TPA: SDR family oxidoreductase [Steroidobacteraceae bacterium]|nr:SDR family oxidoreductase [Steroidobacteraceae bacterium]